MAVPTRASLAVAIAIVIVCAYTLGRLSNSPAPSAAAVESHHAHNSPQPVAAPPPAIEQQHQQLVEHPVVHEQPARPALSRRDVLLQGCAQICRHDTIGTPGPYFETMRKTVDCAGIWANAAIDDGMVEPEPPAAIPAEFRDDYTYGGRVHVSTFFRGILNQRYLGGDALASEWTEQQLNAWAAQCNTRTLEGTYGRDETEWLREGLRRMPIKGARVLVIGSEIPWVEACILGAEAGEIVTLEYGKINSYHPRVKAITPHAMRNLYAQYMGYFDAVVTFSSVEHSGLGRYGDALNPWGDRQTIARAWCLCKPGAHMLIGVMTGGDEIVWNAHRVYGAVMYPHLVANWEQVWRAPGGLQVVHVLKRIDNVPTV